jgi:hypothetical protein
MQKITSTTSLKEAIRQAEEEQAANKQLFKEQLHITAERLKPVNLIKSTLNEAFTSPDFMNIILGAVVGQTAGYVSRKAVVGKTKNPIRKLFGSLLQTGIAALLTTYGDTIKETAVIIFRSLFRKKEEQKAEPELNYEE